MIVCRFSSLDDIPYRHRSSPIIVLQALRESGRFSTFEVDARIAFALGHIQREKWAYLQNEGVSYPWTAVELLPAATPHLQTLSR